MRRVLPLWLCLLPLAGACPAAAEKVLAPTAPSQAAVPSLLLTNSIVAWGGRLAVHVGAGPADVNLQERTGSTWVTVRALPFAAAPRTVIVHVPMKGPSVLYRLRYQGQAGTERRVRLRALSLAAVGDINLGDVPGQQIDRYGAAWPWASVGPVLRAADLAFGNLECAISTRGTPQVKMYTFRGAPSSARAAARAAGLDVLNLANNHAVDFGRGALLDGLRTLRSAGVAPVGAGADEAQAYRPAVVEQLGLRVAFVGFSAILPFEFRAGPNTPGTAWAFPGRVRSAIKVARRRADVVIATFHWGIEKQPVEDAAQRDLAGLALASGADAVIGAHPHVLQPVRRVGARKLIAYSLGNFVFGAHSAGTSTTEILKVGLAADGVRSVSRIPARIVAGRPIIRR